MNVSTLVVVLVVAWIVKLVLGLTLMSMWKRRRARASAQGTKA
jgi:heme/copper-type cytochrome/quinol oxidase subunit 2